MSSFRALCSFSCTRITSGSCDGGSASLICCSTSRNQLSSSSMSPSTSPDFCLARAMRSPRRCTCSQMASNRLLSLVTRPSMVRAPSPGDSWHSCGPVRLMPSSNGLCCWISLSSRCISASWSSRVRLSRDCRMPSTPSIQSLSLLWDWWKFCTSGSMSWAFLSRSAALEARSLYLRCNESSLSFRDMASSLVMCFISSLPIDTT